MQTLIAWTTAGDVTSTRKSKERTMAQRKKTLRKHIWICRSECRNCDEGEWEVNEDNACDPAGREIEDCSLECTEKSKCPGAVRYTLDDENRGG